VHGKGRCFGAKLPIWTIWSYFQSDLAAAASHAEIVAAAVDLTGTRHFTAKRRAIRAALIADGIAAEMENMVDALLPP
jgi:hypothetical protein